MPRIIVTADRPTDGRDRPIMFTLVGSEHKGMTVPLEKRVVVTVENAASRK